MHFICLPANTYHDKVWLMYIFMLNGSETGCVCVPACKHQHVYMGGLIQRFILKLRLVFSLVVTLHVQKYAEFQEGI